jgi:hypothetical protein
MREIRGFGLSVAAAVWAIGFCNMASAQQRVEVQVGPVRVDVSGRDPLRAARFATHRATKVVGMAVKNTAGDDLGKVEDLVIDDRATVRYAAVSFGGFFGFNEKMFGVPFHVLKFKAIPDAATSNLELNVSKESMQKAPSFPADQWPDFGDPKFHREVDEFYLRMSSRRPAVDVR